MHCKLQFQSSIELRSVIISLLQETLVHKCNSDEVVCGPCSCKSFHGNRGHL
jgi:hypothetical protein